MAVNRNVSWLELADEPPRRRDRWQPPPAWRLGFHGIVVIVTYDRLKVFCGGTIVAGVRWKSVARLALETVGDKVVLCAYPQAAGQPRVRLLGYTELSHTDWEFLVTLVSRVTGGRLSFELPPAP